MSKYISDKTFRYRKVSKQKLLDLATKILYHRFEDGRIASIEVFKRKQLIHRSVALYRTVKHRPRLVEVTGKFNEEIFQNYLETIARLDWYDRDPSMQSAFYQGADIAPHAATARDIYTVPQGKKARIMSVYAQIIRITAAGAVGKAFAAVAYTSGTIMTLELFNNTVGVHALDSMSECGILLENEALGITTIDGSTGGTLDWRIHASLIEFDA